MRQPTATTSNGSRVLDNIVSPYGLALFSYAFFWLACLIPPSTYRHYMMEPDLMFLDPATILLYTTCVISFIAGVWLIGWMFPTSIIEHKYRTVISPTAFLALPLLIGIAAAASAVVYLITHYPVILLGLLTQQGGDIKDTVAFQLGGMFTLLPLLLIGLTWWAYNRHFDVEMHRWGRRLIVLCLWISILIMIVLSVVTLSRNMLILGICGLGILYVLQKAANHQLNRRLALRVGISSMVIVAVLFFAFSFLRGIGNWNEQINTFLGYTVASYNRLAAIVNGSLHYPFSGRGIYLSDIVAHSRFLMLSQVMNTPNTLAVWGSEFAAVSQAGLDGRLIWSGAFGYIFSELGWFSFIFLFGYGVLYGFVWNWAKRGMILGVVLYPCFGFSVLFWFGSNYLLGRPLEMFLVVALVLAIYERIFLRTQLDPASNIEVAGSTLH